MIPEYSSKNKKILLLASAMLLLIGMFYLAGFKNNTEPGQIYCTMEAKLCPDGSYVGRTGPKCEFTACPGETAADFNETFSDAKTGIAFRYPKELATEYIRAFDWPPQVQLLDEPLTCNNAGSEVVGAGQTMEKTINGRDYCITKISNGAAGSTYTQYAYAFQKNGGTAILTFTIRSVQCGNYDDPKKTACETERNAFSIDGIIDAIVGTIK